MKIKSIMALSLAFTSYNALAFVSQPIATNAVGSIQAETIADTITSNFYGYQQAGTSQALSIGSCAANPVAGCNCPFCTMLRSHRA
ncbi:hypothetical protein [Rahnella sp. CJA17(1/100)]|uniref:hypothetical protein n=1 Tax=Rahnella sp. CJA17(1/100) TaxID=2508951 RepID=UPI0010702480|nr:hypothetical protein [Rahnella sp. CJA17(1/100)]